ncbi:exodeoxyribonuclease VII large subunit [Jonesiaceae bacterium BS-20]|uniref:Exodeoxyribonuclease 7 large subunit n=1 Tax=Jonesiaceae bacterium BS-20 TaxID=3120821 RepID=A0AAU7DWL3_9MICO
MTSNSSAQSDPAPLPELAAQTTKTSPWPVRLLSAKIAEYIDKMSVVWVEGQVVQLNRRAGMSFITLRDTNQDLSLPVSIFSSALDAAGPLSEGAHVVVRAKPTFWAKRGSFQLQASEIAQLGVGDLLAKIEQLKALLAAEGLFDPQRKKPLPFLPNRVGLICGRNSEAMHDVLVNAKARWPSVQFTVREVAVQGVNAVSQVTAALSELDSNPEIDVIVIARGGGAVEDLLPFSNESLVRAASNAVTPIVSAIGHERDTPILDLVADYRASTPTDAAKRIVPNVAEELAGVDQARDRMAQAIQTMLDREQAGLTAVRSRPSLASPLSLLVPLQQALDRDRSRALSAFDRQLLTASGQVNQLRAQVTALSPAATLARGYAVVQTPTGAIVRRPEQAPVGSEISIRLELGTIDATIVPKP